MLRLLRLRRLAARRRHEPLPAELRARLLAIPSTTAVADPIEPRSSFGAALYATLWSSPVVPIATSLLVAAGLGLLGADPYRIGAGALDRVRDAAAPALSVVRTEAATVGATAARVARSAIAVVPGAGLRASQALTVRLADRLHDDESPLGGTAGERATGRGSRQTPETTEAGPPPRGRG